MQKQFIVYNYNSNKGILFSNIIYMSKLYGGKSVFKMYLKNSYTLLNLKESKHIKFSINSP